MTHSISLKKARYRKAKKNVKNIVENLASSIPKTIKHFFPQFKKQLQNENKLEIPIAL